MQLFNNYASLSEKFSLPLSPRSFQKPQLIALNETLAQKINLNITWLQSHEGLQFLSKGQRPDKTPPVAMAYAGHQFGHFVPRLGDGRAMLVGEVNDNTGKLYDIHLKGSGPTPFSRGGDGFSALGPVLREYIVSEAMAALGIPTTRSLAALTTGENVSRDSGVLPGAVLARISLSHIRVGTFQYFAAQRDTPSLQTLTKYALQRLYPEYAGTTNPALSLLQAVTRKQAQLIAQWMLVGFIHGVMNTDNTSIAGETIDFGPCAFLDEYDPDKTFSFIDQNGRYAYGKQPHMALWNLERLAEALLPLIAPDTNEAVTLATESLNHFNDIFSKTYLTGRQKKLGLTTDQSDDPHLITKLLTLMQQDKADFTLTFRQLSDSLKTSDFNKFSNLFKNHEAISSWTMTWKDRILQENLSTYSHVNIMQSHNPRIIPRNHKIEEVIIAANQNDYQPFQRLIKALSDPYSEGTDEYEIPPTPNERITNTFCGT